MIGSVVVVALLVGILIAWRVSLRRLQHEVEAVKSGNTDKRLSTASASGEQDAVSAGGRLGSSAQGGSGNGGNLAMAANQLANGGRGAPVGAKGSQNGGNGAAGGGGTGGNSEDSAAAAAQYDKPPLEVLNTMMTALASELDDRHLTILEVIGQGGFGVVYRGERRGGGRGR